jgi:uroporphyrinogen decarboxylase
MTGKQRVATALAHQQPDRVPFHIKFTRLARQRMIEHLDDPDFEAKILSDVALYSIRTKVNYRQVEPDIWQDEFGVRYDCTVDKDIGTICNRLVTPETLDRFAFPEPHSPARYDELAGYISANRDRFIVINFGFALFERAWSLAGMEDLLAAMLDDPGFVSALLDRIVAFDLAVVEDLCCYDIDAIWFGDDWGSQLGLMMGPALWRRFIKPRIARLYQATRQRGKRVFTHSCGKVEEIFPDLIEIGLDVFNPFQPEVMDVYAMKQAYGDRLSFCGGISTQRLLPFGTVQEVRAEVADLCRRIGEGGGYIAAPAHSLPADSRPENILAMLDVLQGQPLCR